MIPTDEQLLAINHRGDSVVSALAGTGKTSLLIEKSKHLKDKILYLVYNRSVKLEADKKFKKAGITNIDILTNHGLAHKYFNVKKYLGANKLKTSNFKSYEILDILRKKDTDANLAIAAHAVKLFNIFTYSKEEAIEEVKYQDYINSNDALGFYKHNKVKIYDWAQALWETMLAGRCDITHDFYLKAYQLTKPKLHYAHILTDESQDSNPVSLDIVLNQKAFKTFVGDENQAIYAWRGAVNAMSQMDYPRFYLTNSFRFDQRIADLANSVLAWKKHIGVTDLLNLKGVGGKETGGNLSAYIGRTNVHLLTKFIELMDTGLDMKPFFEGGYDNYIFNSSGTSIYDVLNLFIGKRDRIKSDEIKAFQSFPELEQYIESTEDKELDMIRSLVKRFNKKLFIYLPAMKKKQVPRKDAKIIFTTCHKAKGLEYANVMLSSGFFDRKKLQTLIDNKELGDEKKKQEINQEINISYVAITRAIKNIKFESFSFEKD